MIEEMLEKMNNEVTKSLPRPYCGLSGIGTKCHRKLQHQHYWTYKSKVSARIQRLFNVGHSAELDMTSALFEAGFKVFGQQTKIVATAGHWKGHIDGIASKGGKSYLVEFKTHNDKSFKDLLKKQVKASKPTHYAQMTAYMGYLGLKQALYMAYNKNDSEYYIEIVKFDEEYFDDLRRKEQEIIASDALLPRIGNNSPAWFECKMCDAREVCFGRETIEETCRTCIHVDVERGGVWRCTYPDNLSETHFLSAEQQEVACASYELNEMFDD